MRFNFLRRDPKANTSIVIITGSCCIPGFAPFDEQARQAVAQAIAETGVDAQVTEVTAASTMFGAAPRSIVAQLFETANRGRMPLPMVMINGNIASSGIPTNVEAIKTVLLSIVEAETITEKENK